MFGREVNLPVHLLIPSMRAVTPRSTHEYVDALRENMQVCYDHAREHLKVAAERQKRYHDTRIKENKYQVGDMVYRHNHMRSKLDPSWLGPLVVVGVLSDCLYRVAGKKKCCVLHHDLLMPCQTGGQKPKWLTRVQQQFVIK